MNRSLRQQRRKMRAAVGRYVFLPAVRAWGRVTTVSESQTAGARIEVGRSEVARLVLEENPKRYDVPKKYHGTVKPVYVDAVYAYPADVCFDCRTDAACSSHREAWAEAARRAMEEVHDG